MASEQAQPGVLTDYLPGQFSREEIADLNAKGPRQMGQVMRTLMPQLKGLVDGRVVNQVVSELLRN